MFLDISRQQFCIQHKKGKYLSVHINNQNKYLILNYTFRFNNRKKKIFLSVVTINHS